MIFRLSNARCPILSWKIRNGANFESWKNHDVLILLCREVPRGKHQESPRQSGQVAPVILGRSAKGPFERLEGMHDGPVERLQELHDGLADRFEIAQDAAAPLKCGPRVKHCRINACQVGIRSFILSQCERQVHEVKISDYQLKHGPSVASRLIDMLK